MHARLRQTDRQTLTDEHHDNSAMIRSNEGIARSLYSDVNVWMRSGEMVQEQ